MSLTRFLLLRAVFRAVLRTVSPRVPVLTNSGTEGGQLRNRCAASNDWCRPPDPEDERLSDDTNPLDAVCCSLRSGPGIAQKTGTPAKGSWVTHPSAHTDPPSPPRPPPAHPGGLSVLRNLLQINTVPCTSPSYFSVERLGMKRDNAPQWRTPRRACQSFGQFREAKALRTGSGREAVCVDMKWRHVQVFAPWRCN